MRKLPVCLLALALAAAPALGTAATRAAGPASSLSFRFQPLDNPLSSVAEGDAFVDFGTVSARPGNDRRRGIVVRQRIAVRLEGRPGAPASARVSVALAAETPGCSVRVNGMPVTMLPRLIDPVHRVGAAVVYDVEVMIPPSVPAGAFLSNLQWFAESD